jgi:hypothetical protein
MKISEADKKRLKKLGLHSPEAWARQLAYEATQVEPPPLLTDMQLGRIASRCISRNSRVQNIYKSIEMDEAMDGGEFSRGWSDDKLEEALELVYDSLADYYETNSEHVAQAAGLYDHSLLNPSQYPRKRFNPVGATYEEWMDRVDERRGSNDF